MEGHDRLLVVPTAQGMVEGTAVNQRWWACYNAYLKSDNWKEISRLVIERARFICEGCAALPAVHAHHMTYEHVGNEFLWELKAVCKNCHRRLHKDKTL